MKITPASVYNRLCCRSAIDLKRPIFIWGAGRSGTHLLYDILSLHPGVETLKTSKRWKKGLWGDMNWGDSTPEGLKGMRIPYEGMQTCWIDAGVDYDSIGLLKGEDLTPAVMEKIRGRYRQLRRTPFWDRSGTRYRVLDKCPTYVLMVDAIEAVFPDAFHVYCIRDPRSILNSLLRLYRFPDRPETGRGGIDVRGFWSHIPPGHEAYRDKPLIERLTWQLTALHEVAMDAGKRLGPRLVLFHYEGLMRQAAPLANRLAASLELSPASVWDELLPPTFPDLAPPWPDRDGNVEVGHSKKRCYEDSEIADLECVELLARKLGYAAHRPGVVEDESLESLCRRPVALASV